MRKFILKVSLLVGFALVAMGAGCQVPGATGGGEDCEDEIMVIDQPWSNDGRLLCQTGPKTGFGYWYLDNNGDYIVGLSRVPHSRKNEWYIERHPEHTCSIDTEWQNPKR